MDKTITEEQLAALESLDMIYTEHGEALPGATEMLRDLVAGFRRQRVENQKLRERHRNVARRSARYWCRAARAAFGGDDKELRNRVALAEAAPMELVLSEAQP